MKRLATLEAIIALLYAKFLVRFVPLGRWRGSLGLAEKCDLPSSPATPAALLSGRLLAQAVRRGSYRLPGHTKCLPEAMALQWMLARRGLASRLVIAVLKENADPAIDRYHAWVEMGGEMLIGQCDVSAYQPIMRMDQNGTAAAQGGIKR